MLPKRALSQRVSTKNATKTPNPSLLAPVGKSPRSTDWDSPSSHTGTVKRRPTSLETGPKFQLSSIESESPLTPPSTSKSAPTQLSSVAAKVQSKPKVSAASLSAPLKTNQKADPSKAIPTTTKTRQSGIPKQLSTSTRRVTKPSTTSVDAKRKQTAAPAQRTSGAPGGTFSEQTTSKLPSTVQSKAARAPTTTANKPQTTTSSLINQTDKHAQSDTVAQSTAGAPKLLLSKSKCSRREPPRRAATLTDGCSFTELYRDYPIDPSPTARAPATTTTSIITQSTAVTAVQTPNTESEPLNGRPPIIALNPPAADTTQDTAHLRPDDIHSAEHPQAAAAIVNAADAPSTNSNGINLSHDDATKSTPLHIVAAGGSHTTTSSVPNLNSGGSHSRSTSSLAAASNKLVNEIHRFRDTFALQKFPSIPKLTNRSYRFFSGTPTTSTTTLHNASSVAASASELALDRMRHHDFEYDALLKPFGERQITRANSNDYVLFNPTRSPARIMAKALSPTVDILSKPEFTSHQFRNIPVRPRRGIPHLENYCLFDPTKDFVSDKVPLQDVDDDEELIEEIIYDDRLEYTEDETMFEERFGVIEEVNEVSSSVTSSTSGSNDSTLGTSTSTDSSGDLLLSSVIDIAPPNPHKDESNCRVIGKPILKKPSPYANVNHKKSFRPLRDSSDDAAPEAAIYVNESAHTMRQSSSSPQLMRPFSLKMRGKSRGSLDAESNYVLLHSDTGHRTRCDKFAQTGARPKSQHSDVDSGFLSPASPMPDCNAATAELVDNIEEYVKLSQLNTGTPYIDDYYYTVFKERRSRAKGERENQAHKDNQMNHPFSQPTGHAHLVLISLGNKNHNQRNNNNHHNNHHQSNGRHNNNNMRERKNSESKDGKEQTPRTYTPLQFENSLGKLQCGSVTAPRKIIDMDVVGAETSSTSGPLAINTEITTQRKSRQLLIHIETLYRVVLKLEDFENPTAIATALVIKIYTDWANYYLERAKSKKKVNDLSADCRDGLLLADVIEAVTTFKVTELTKKPKTQQQMFDNVNSCLTVLRAHSVCGLDSITTNDICAGRLKAVLALFFALSRFKQATKQKTSSSASINTAAGNAEQPYGAITAHQQQLLQQQQLLHQQQVQQQQRIYQQVVQLPPSATSVPSSNGEPGAGEMTNRQIPVPYAKAGNGGTSIPLPATVMVTRRCPPDKVRPLPPTPGLSPSIPGLTKAGCLISDSNSRPGSPPNSRNGTPTHIPKGGNGFRPVQPGCKIPASPYSVTTNPTTTPHHHQSATNTAAATNNSNTKHSMLDKLKLFKNNDKSDRASTKTQTSKRTSSSSGFSSARSERSDSSLSLNEPPQPPQQPRAKKSELSIPVPAKSKSKLLGSNKSISSTKEASSNPKEKPTARTDTEATTKMPAPKVQKSISKQELPIPKPTSLGRKLEVRSESKSSLSSQIQPPKSMLVAPTATTVNTGIPKPTAFIKGTTKPATKNGAAEPVKQDQKFGDISPTKNISALAPNETKMQISNEQYQYLQSQQQTQQQQPIPPPQPPTNQSMCSVLSATLHNTNISMSDSSNSKSHSSSPGLQSNSSDSSVIYRPSSESGSDAMHLKGSPMMSPLGTPSHPKTIGSNRNLSMFVDPHQSNQRTPMSMPNSGSQQFSPKFNTVPSKMMNGVIFEEDKQMTVMPMRPLLRGYNSHVTLPTRGTRGQHLVAEYCDELTQGGYCSDGDALRKEPGIRYTDIENGYMSEGDGGMHGKHVLSMMRSRPQLPTTIEERCRSSHGESLDCVGTTKNAASTATVQSRHPHHMSQTMELNGGAHHHQRSMHSRSIVSPMSGREQMHWASAGGNNANDAQMLQQQQMQHHQQMQMQMNGMNGQHHNPLGAQSPSNRKEHHSSGKHSPSHSRRGSSTATSGGTPKTSHQSRTKGVPQSFGYSKRMNGAAPVDPSNGTHMLQQSPNGAGGRMAHVSAVPRTNKVKVSGGTQTCTTDMHTKIPPNNQNRSFSLTGPGAAQLSQSIRERLSTGSHSLPKQTSDLHVFQQRLSGRGSAKMNDGSLSDTQAYAEVKTDYSSYATWLKHSNTAASRLSEGDSLESLAISSPGGMQRAHKLMHRDSTYSHSPRLNRSNSIRSTKSEKMYPSMLSRGPDIETEPFYCVPVGTMPTSVSTVPWSQPTSPTPPNRVFGVGPLSPTHPGGGHRLTYPKKNDDVHGSAASLLSGGSSLYGSAEERQANEVRRLKRELCDARDQVMSLSTQLSTNAHVVNAFEQSLTNMTQRLQQLSVTADRKDGELTEMRQTIELLRKQSIQAGLTSAHMNSMNIQHPPPPPSHAPSSRPPIPIAAEVPPALPPANPATHGSESGNQSSSSMQRHLSADSMCSLNSMSSDCSAQDKKKKKGWLRSSFTKAFSRNAKISKTSRQVSTASHLDQAGTVPPPLPPANASHDSSTLPPPSPTKSPRRMLNNHTSINPTIPELDIEGNPIVEDLKKQLREKDLVLTDIRLEALSSASQLECLKDTVSKMRQEMMNLKQNNERLQKMVTSRSLAGSECSLGGPISPSGSLGEPRRYSLAEANMRPPLELPKSLDETDEDNIPPAPAPEPPPSTISISSSPSRHSSLTSPTPILEEAPTDHLTLPAEDITDHTDGKKISIVVYLGQPESFPKYAEEIQESDIYYSSTSSSSGKSGELGTTGGDPNGSLSNNRSEFIIAFTYISGKTTWQNLDYIVRKTFKDYVARIDPGTNLGLNTDSITSYHLGDAKRGPEMGFPELLPCGYIIGNVRSLYICLQGVGSLAFESLIPRSIVHRYISLLTEHRRLILCGPSGTGKSYLARKLAEFLVARSQRGTPSSEAIATFNVDHKSQKELRQYLGHIAEQASMSNGASEDLPSVIILDNLHHASALGDVFQVLLGAGPAAQLPCIIGTMSQATCNTTNLQLHHNFRWVLTANHMEPVKGFLGRYLRRRLYAMELATHTTQPQLAAILAWLPGVWQHINQFLETHSSSDVTIGPRLFLSCPLDVTDSQVWFTDVWNYHLEPYLVDAVREGVQLYGRRGGVWVDPSEYIHETYPWPTLNGTVAIPSLRLINAEDVGLEGGVTGNMDSQDPLVNMLMRLQEAANYNGVPEQESDCASLDSNITQDSSAGAE